MSISAAISPPRIPLSKKQIVAYVESQARLNILVGAVRSGKSFIGLIRFIRELETGPQGDYIICGRSERTIQHNIISPLKDLYGDIFSYNHARAEFTMFGKRVYVIGANDERAESKIRGSTFAGALVDEVTILPEGFFKMLLSRLSIPGAKLIGTTNPDSPYHWFKTGYLDRADELDLRVFNFNLDDNPSLSEKFKDSLKAEYKGIWHRRFILGEWVLAEGSVFDFFDIHRHVVPEPPHYAKYYFTGIDYGTNNPFAALLIGYNDDYRPELFVQQEIYFDSVKAGYQKTDSDYRNDLASNFDCYAPTINYVDPSASSFELELKRAKKAVKQANNDILDGVRFVSNLLINGNLVICKSCVNLIREIESYVWDAKRIIKGEDKPLKKNDHAIDALRYALHTHFGGRLSLRNKSREERELEKFRKNPMQFPGFGPNTNGWQNLNQGGFF